MGCFIRNDCNYSCKDNKTGNWIWRWICPIISWFMLGMAKGIICVSDDTIDDFIVRNRYAMFWKGQQKNELADGSLDADSPSDRSRNMVIKDNDIYRGIKASITVEASYICTAVIFLVILMIYMSFFCHDQAIAKSDAAYLAQLTVRNSLKWLNIETKTVNRDEEFSHLLTDSWNLAYESRRQQIIDEGYRLIQSKMLFCKIDDVMIDCSYNYILNQLQCTVNVNGHLNFSISLLGKTELKFIETGEAVESDAIKAIWIKNTLKDIGQKE